MIENFSEEELKQIMKELRAKEEKEVLKNIALFSEKRKALKIAQGKPVDAKILHQGIVKIIDLALNNFTEGSWHTGKRILCSNKIENEKMEEYKEMYNKILDIFIQYNKEYLEKKEN